MAWMILGGIAIVLGLAAYAFFIEPFRVQLTRVEIPIPGLPSELNGFRICHLSDTHTAGYGKLERRIEMMLSGLEADLCVITGDLLNSPDGIPALTRVLESLHPRFGTYAVLGNGDHKGVMPLPDLVESISAIKINLLINSHDTVMVNDHSLRIIGVDDPFKGRDQIGRATAGLPRKGFRILLAHAPDIMAEIDGYHANLALAGHTHGGQVRLPFLGAVWLHSSRSVPVCCGYFDSGTLSRLLRRDMSGVRMYVSRGLGASGITARFACPPEIALITLKEKV